MFLEFTTIENLRGQRKDRVAPNGIKIPWYNNHNKYSLWAQFFYCKCGHIYYAHDFETEKCDADYFEPCNCTKLEFCEVQMEITFTLADLFEVENPDHSDPESPQWIVEFGEWYEKYKNENLI